MPLRTAIVQLRPSVFEICTRHTPQGATQYTVIGTGFLVRDEWAVTCNHVVRGLADNEVGVRYSLSERNSVATGHYSVKAVYHFEEIDIALIKMEKPIGLPHQPISATPADTWVGQPIYSAGYPLGADLQRSSESRAPMVTHGIIADIVSEENPDTVRHYVLDITAHPGCSGAPVFLETGEIFGVLNSGHPVFVAANARGVATERVGVGHALAIPMTKVSMLIASLLGPATAQ